MRSEMFEIEAILTLSLRYCQDFQYKIKLKSVQHFPIYETAQHLQNRTSSGENALNTVSYFSP
jgi:hypothetical protein